MTFIVKLEKVVKILNHVFIVVAVVGLVGCSTPAKKVKGLQLGMTPDEVQDSAGTPTTIRAAKIFDDGKATAVWEYQPSFLQLNPQAYWVYFENDKVVQWGQPGDFAGKTGLNVPVEEYRPVRGQK
jgi:hypothetical protein